MNDQRSGASWEDRPLSRSLSPDECWARIVRAPYGRIAAHAAEEIDIFPVTHGVDDGCVVFRTAPGTKLIELTIHKSIAFQIDGYDEDEAFSVVVKGEAEEVSSAAQIDRLDGLGIRSWAPEEKDRWVRVNPVSVAGRIFTLPAPND
ncbi:pyridoxamine 5'-phosphate oxidase family protein [Microbacterium profundi]|uniref:pyridoxamine 5'-phosphate oxidase family protein n=1 Tax=Microbacterium profundi TaxID=450380 RepID=UPI0019CFE8CC|nr:pyridoxamine 5'-phosphate oxidase family protein [Microbacterium profundi]MCE7481813.1 pyridoxamine 5'-phosphate oxidase family protein [Microbacterium profundi]